MDADNIWHCNLDGTLPFARVCVIVQCHKLALLIRFIPEQLKMGNLFSFSPFWGPRLAHPPPQRKVVNEFAKEKKMRKETAEEKQVPECGGKAGTMH